MKKKYIIFIILIILSLLYFIIYQDTKDKPTNNDLSNLADSLNKDEIAYILDNNIEVNNLKEYLKYKNFNLYNYYHYENIRLANNYSHLESINSFKNRDYYNPYHNIKPALFLGTSIVLVNKCFYLEKDYIPTALVNVMDYEIEYTNADIMLKKVALEKYEQMYKDANKDNIEFVLFSGFRSYKRQEYLFYKIYNDDTISAKPGHSEHQTGYAIDISTRDIGLSNYLETTDTYTWLITNCSKYGFILRFPKDKTLITFYQFEPWHFRYVGSIAAFIMDNNLSLEEYIFSNLEI